ncbi:MAG: flavodoxin [Treponema sp.]|jgi:flavodoxin|nr:flavodoxin [Treponema sp.]
MKTAIVYYSLDGNCDFTARHLGKLLGADIVKIELLKEVKYKGFMKILWGGMQVVFKKTPALKPYNFDPSLYDLIIIGTPVWAGSPCSPVNSLLSHTKITGRKIALFACHAGGPGDVMKKLKSSLEGNNIISSLDICKAVTNPEKTCQKLDEWVKIFNN